MKRIISSLIVLIFMSLVISCDFTNLNRDTLSIVEHRVGVLLNNNCKIRYSIDFEYFAGSSSSTYAQFYCEFVEVTENGYKRVVDSSDNSWNWSGSKSGTVYLDISADVQLSNSKRYVIIVHRYDPYNPSNKIKDVSDDIDLHIFPSECYSFSIKLNVNGLDVEQGKCVYITKTPSMPNLQARIEASDLSDYYEWKLDIIYDRHLTADGTKLEKTFYKNMYGSETWYINDDFDTLMYGGQAVLTAQNMTNSINREFKFDIRGTNEDVFVIENYINSIPNKEWYFKYVAKHESGPCATHGRCFNQFNEAPLLQSEPDCGNRLDVKFTPNGSFDGGFGVYQLTWFTDPVSGITRVPNINEVYDWMDNVNMGTRLLTNHQAFANNYVGNLRVEAVNYYFLKDQISVYQAQDSALIPDDTVYNVIFKDSVNTNNKLFEHAVAMKRYNGLGKPGFQHHYLEWDEDNHRWDIFDYAVYEVDGEDVYNYYVKSICKPSNYP